MQSRACGQFTDRLDHRTQLWGSLILPRSAQMRWKIVGRIRTIKPEFFKHSDLFDLEQETKLPIRISYAGLWTCCDREGRFKWRPRELKIDILPYDDCEFSRVLDALATRGFIVKYGEYGFIPAWKSHQFINNKEPQSQIPEPFLDQVVDVKVTREPRVDDAIETRGVKEGKGKEEKRKRKDAPPSRESFDGMELQIANEVLKENRIPPTQALTRIAGQALVFECERLGSPEKATDSMRQAIVDGLARGDIINAFWFQDQKYDSTRKQKTKQEQQIDEIRRMEL